VILNQLSCASGIEGYYRVKSCNDFAVYNVEYLHDLKPPIIPLSRIISGNLTRFQKFNARDLTFCCGRA
jgi:hypothetical protein